jgi:hypothetical protein
VNLTRKLINTFQKEVTKQGNDLGFKYHHRPYDKGLFVSLWHYWEVVESLGGWTQEKEGGPMTEYL